MDGGRAMGISPTMNSREELKMKSTKMSRGALCVAVVMVMGCLAGTNLSAATIDTPTLEREILTNVDLSASENVDWKFFGETNYMEGGAGIGTLSVTYGSTTGCGWDAPTTYDYTNGHDPASATGVTAGQGWYGNNTAVLTASYELTFTAPGTGTYTATVYGIGWRIGTQVTASLTGTTNQVVDLDATLAGSPYDPWTYTVSFTPDNAGDVLTLTVQANGQNVAENDYNGIGMSAATFAVPEPATMSLLGIGAVLAIRRRRR